jgi:hypothetical protein
MRGRVIDVIDGKLVIRPEASRGCDVLADCSEATLDDCDCDVTFDLVQTLCGFEAINVRPADESV